MKTQALSVEITRGNSTESIHQVSAIVLDGNASVLAEYGNSNFLVFPRSCIKPLQALFVADTNSKLDDKRLALACASHSGEFIHSETVSAWLHEMQLGTDNLACGAHYPYNEESNRELIKEDKKPSAIHNNCSGKHCGLVQTCLALSYPIEGYNLYEHSLQRKMRAEL